MAHNAPKSPAVFTPLTKLRPMRARPASRSRSLRDTTTTTPRTFPYPERDCYRPVAPPPRVTEEHHAHHHPPDRPGRCERPGARGLRRLGLDRAHDADGLERAQLEHDRARHD